ncbi:MAG: hypothetical protein IPL65_20605 [Lewinellaceae bacterium]|nr:hypothetical protein [Lewinellaceae bacterium]
MNAQDVKQNLHTIIDQAFTEMDALKHKVSQSTSELRQNIQGELHALEVKKQELETRMAALRSATADKQEELSKAVEESAASFRKGLKRIAAVFNEESEVQK